MSDEERFTPIRITKTPAGDAPEHIKEQWVGLILPGYYFGKPEKPVQEVSVVLGNNTQIERAVYIVSIWRALEILKQKSPEAAEYYEELPALQSLEYFTFGVDEVIPMLSPS
ncbi:hypothetical protein ACFL3E_02320 [Patescibacteria group bacterium]